MKLLLLNLDCVGELLPLAIRAAKAGHEVRIWFAKETPPDTGKGFEGIKIIDNWLGSAKWAELIVPSGNHQFVSKWDQLRKAGMKVFGPTVASADLEINRAEGMALFQAAGIEVPPHKEFSSLDDAEAHVKKTEERYVFKTLGSEDDKSLSYVSKSPADMIARLQRWKKMGMSLKGKVMLQEVIEGVEVGVSRWMGTKGWVGPPNVNFEHKKLLSGDAGPNCGEAGTLLKYGEDKLFGEILGPCEKALRALGHLGDVDVNAIVDDKGKAWPLEWTTRMGWPAENMLIATTQGDPVEWMLAACEGRDSLKVSQKICCGVVVSQPPYPEDPQDPKECADVPIYGVTAANENYLYPQSVCRQKMPDMDGSKVSEKDIWTATGNYVLVVTGQGKTVRQATTRAYDTLHEISLSNMSYRDDIGEKLEDEIPKLQKHGYCTEWSYG